MKLKEIYQDFIASTWGELNASALKIVKISLKVGAIMGGAVVGLAVYSLMNAVNLTGGIALMIGILALFINLGQLKILKNVKGKQDEARN